MPPLNNFTRSALALAMSQAVAMPALATTFFVDNFGDTVAADNTCTLREAILTANPPHAPNDCGQGVAGPDAILFNNTTPQTIALTNGQLPITSGLTIQGPVANRVTIDGSGNLGERIFDITDGTLVAISNLTISGASTSTAYGAGMIISFGSSVSITNSTITGNTTTLRYGGGIHVYDNSSLTLTNSTVSANTSAYHGGGISVQENSRLDLINSTISNNTAYAGFGGGISGFDNSSVVVTNSTLSGNTSSYGGGIGAFGNLTVTGSNLTANLAYYRGGGIFSGGGATATINNSTLNNNGAAYYDGGGIYLNSGTVNVNRSTVWANGAYGDGGGIHVLIGTLNVNNSTITSNLSYGRAGGISAISSAGTNLKNSTVAGNVSTDLDNMIVDAAGGIWAQTTPLDLRNTIVSGNNAISDSEFVRTEVYLAAGATITGSNNVLGDQSDTNAQAFAGFTAANFGITATSNGTKPTTFSSILKPLAGNGGPTQTHNLADNSPAINAGSNAVCAAAPIFNLDQIGLTRPVGTICDIGSVEFRDDTTFFVVPLPGGKVVVFGL